MPSPTAHFACWPRSASIRERPTERSPRRPASGIRARSRGCSHDWSFRVDRQRQAGNPGESTTFASDLDARERRIELNGREGARRVIAIVAVQRASLHLALPRTPTAQAEVDTPARLGLRV
jgi:hypothetical protein